MYLTGVVFEMPSLALSSSRQYIFIPSTVSQALVCLMVTNADLDTSSDPQMRAELHYLF